MFYKPYLLNMLARLQDTIPEFTTHRDNGVADGFNPCCIDLYDKLTKLGISPGVTMDYLFGEDTPGIGHVRCPECRQYCGPVNIDKFCCKVLIRGKVYDRTPESIMNDVGQNIRTLVATCG